MEFLTQLAETWSQPQARHAMTVHLPIGLAFVALVVTALSALRGGKVKGLRWSSLAVLAALALSAWVALRSGEGAEGTVEGALSDRGEHVLHEHEELAEKVLIAALLSAACAGLALLERPAARRAGTWAAAIGSLATTALVGATAHHGGELVYRFGAVQPTEAPAPVFVAGEATDDPRVARFRDEVFPILSGECWKCHNPARRERSGGLDQTSIATLLEGGEGGPAVVPGDPEASRMVHALSFEDPDLQMPPRGRLEDAQIEVLRRWIADGAVWDVPAQAAR